MPRRIFEGSQRFAENGSVARPAEIGGAALGEASVDLYEGLFDEDGLRLLGAFVNGERFVTAARAMKLKIEAAAGIRQILLRKFGLPTDSPDNNRLVYLALHYGVIPFEPRPLPDDIAASLGQARENLSGTALVDRENLESRLQALRRSGEGLTSSDIAAEMKIPSATVRDQRQTLLKKLVGTTRLPKGSSYGKVAFEFGLIEPASLEEKLGFAADVRQRTQEQRVSIELAKPITIADLTIGSPESIDRPDGRYTLVRLMPAEVYRARQIKDIGQQNGSRASSEMVPLHLLLDEDGHVGEADDLSTEF